MIINKSSLSFPMRLLSLIVFIFTIIGIFIYGSFWLIIISFLCIIPYSKMDGIEISKDRKKLIQYKYIWFRKKLTTDSLFPNNIKNILLQTFNTTVREYRHVGGFHLRYKSKQEYKLFFFLNDKTIAEIKHPKLFDHGGAYRIAYFISKTLNLSIYEKNITLKGLRSYDNETYIKTGKDPSLGFHMLNNQDKEQ